MATPEPALMPVPETHVHAATETCPTCDQPIPNEKAMEIPGSGRGAETSRRRGRQRPGGPAHCRREGADRGGAGGRDRGASRRDREGAEAGWRRG